jgi:1-deoxy-D-xylulose 5-phosphate reductoisomerase
VQQFLAGDIQFVTIPRIVRKMLDSCGGQSNFSTVSELLQYDRSVREETKLLIERDYR